MENEFKIFGEKLDAEIEKYRIKLKFCREHKFKKEVVYLQDKIHMMQEINSEINLIAYGNRKAKEAKFYFND